MRIYDLNTSPNLTRESTGETMANTSSANGKSAFLREPASYEAIDYFQGLEQFREEGLPQHLPTKLEAELCQNSEIIRLKLEISNANLDPDQVAQLGRDLRNLMKRLRNKALEQYKKEWVKDRRDWKILTRGKSTGHCNLDRTHILIILFPERRRIAELMQRDESLNDTETRQANLDLCTLCIRDCTVVYRPGEEPTTNGKCPVCHQDINR